jgi:hypothetical protein
MKLLLICWTISQLYVLVWVFCLANRILRLEKKLDEAVKCP